MNYGDGEVLAAVVTFHGKNGEFDPPLRFCGNSHLEALKKAVDAGFYDKEMYEEVLRTKDDSTQVIGHADRRIPYCTMEFAMCIDIDPLLGTGATRSFDRGTAYRCAEENGQILEQDDRRLLISDNIRFDSEKIKKVEEEYEAGNKEIISKAEMSKVKKPPEPCI